MATRIDPRREERGTPRPARFPPELVRYETAEERLEAYGGAGVLDFAKGMYALRRRRDALFGEAISSEPAWDILLHLFIAGAEGRVVTVLSACEGAAAPQTTGLRKLRQLEQARLIVRIGDPKDARRSYVRLSHLACRKMRSLLKERSHECGQGP